MKKSKWGRIINIASAHALVASPFRVAYVAAKHGILGFTKSTALEALSSASACNADLPRLCPHRPGRVNQIADTAKARGISDEAVIRDVLLAAQPTKGFVKVSDVAALSVFLTSEAANLDQRRGALDRWRLGRAVSRPPRIQPAKRHDLVVAVVADVGATEIGNARPLAPEARDFFLVELEVRIVLRHRRAAAQPDARTLAAHSRSR